MKILKIPGICAECWAQCGRLRTNGKERMVEWLLVTCVKDCPCIVKEICSQSSVNFICDMYIKISFHIEDVLVKCFIGVILFLFLKHYVGLRCRHVPCTVNLLICFDFTHYLY